MGIVEWWRELVHPVATSLNCFRIDDAHVLGGGVSSEPAIAEETYFQISALTVRLAHEASYFKRFVPGIAAVVTETLASGTREYIRVAGTSSLSKLQASGIAETISVNTPVSPLIPFSGGSVDVVLGLVAFQTSDALPGLLDLAADVSKLVGGPAAAAAAETVGDVVAKGFESLLGSGPKDLKLALEHRWSGPDGDEETTDALVLREGYWVLLHERSRQHDDLWVKEGQLMTGEAPSDLQALDGVDYMVLRIETRATRDDWRDFCREELDRRDSAFARDDREEVIQQSRAAKFKIINSRLFTRADKHSRVAELSAEEKSLVATIGTAAQASVTGEPATTQALSDLLEGAGNRGVHALAARSGERLMDFLV